MANEEHLAILKQGVEVWNEWREENPNTCPDLSGADLRKANLHDAVLTGAVLTEAVLVEANLQGAKLQRAVLVKADLQRAALQSATLEGANLVWATLKGASLERAFLIWANLQEANLQGTNLQNAYLQGVNLQSAYLEETNLTRVSCSGVQFSDIDLSQAIGLETIEHSRPSYIDIHTLYKSQGHIPEVFLRGCGVPEDFITFIPSLTCKPFEFYSCFISYSHNDKVFARHVHDTLQGRGIRCWLDEIDFVPGVGVFENMERSIRLNEKVLFCASKSSLASQPVDIEVGLTFDKEDNLPRTNGEKQYVLIPLNLDNFLFDDAYQSEKKCRLQDRWAANFNGWERDNAVFEREIERVIKALRTDGGKEPPPESKL